jgi:hypothetical protein
VAEPFSGPTEATASRHEAWEVALDRIELDLIRAEQAMAHGTGLARLDEWRVPEYYGPIPVVLRPRAEEILERQRRMVRQISEQLNITVQHQSIVDGAARLSSQASDLAVYIDVNA